MKKGFTLIELLAVIVILAIIALIAAPIVLNIINDTKKNATLRSSGFYLDALKNEIALENQKQGGSFSPSVCEITNHVVLCDEKELTIKIDGELPTSGIIIFKNGKVTNANLTYQSGTVTLNNKGELVLRETNNNSICKLIDDADNSNTITSGDKYLCKVKDNMEAGFKQGYYFFVLSDNEDATTNLIMERNIYYDEINDIGKIATVENNGIIPWNSDVDNNAFGPVTAMNYLHNATKDWNNVPNIIMNYEDENIDYHTQKKGTNGYGRIKTIDNITIITNKNGEETAKIENLKARMPRYDEVHGTGKCLTKTETGKYGSCPLWLSNYLHNSEYVLGEDLKNISGINGYWTLSSNSSTSYGVWRVDWTGVMSHDTVFHDYCDGVRPVITVEL